ncbi:MAG: ABC transporter ATP-binding protein/permease [Pseudomonadales bacterium]|nr:ABC transporter ATP-binding protein/permease [Pseudomonadales bacterium]
MTDHSNTQLLWTLTKGFRSTYAAAIGAMATGYLCLFSAPMLAKFSIDAIIEGDNFSPPMWLTRLIHWLPIKAESDIFPYLIAISISTLLLTLLSGLCLFLRGRFVAIASEGITRLFRDRLFNHLEHLPSSFHDSADTGDLVQRCTSDLENVRIFMASQVMEIARVSLIVLLVLPILFTLDANMAWLSLLSLPLLLLSSIAFFQRVKSRFLLVDQAEACMTSILQENLTGIRVVKAYARQDFEIEKFSSANADFRDQNTRLLGLIGIFYGFSDLICLTQIGILLLAGSLWVIAGSLTIGTLFAFLTYESIIIWPIRHLGRVLTDSGKAIVSIDRLSELLLEPRESELQISSPEALAPKRLQGGIVIEQLTFGYQPNNPVLENLSLNLDAGQTLAILGGPGSGKSTLCLLLMRLYDYPKGSITLGGEELSSLDRKHVRSQISIVPQEPFLYATSILNNIKIGNLHADQQAVEKAARQANIHSAIMSFPMGYHTIVGERGMTLSGGQRQRLALARALLKSPPVIILDDALSAVDTQTEASILDALKENCRRLNQTTLIIAHRLSTVMHADKIIVLNKGKIAQSGNHESLANQPGIYQKLCEIQAIPSFQSYPPQLAVGS